MIYSQTCPNGYLLHAVTPTTRPAFHTPPEVSSKTTSVTQAAILIFP